MKNLLKETQENWDKNEHFFNACPKCVRMLKRAETRGVLSPQKYAIAKSDSRERRSLKLSHSSIYFVEPVSVINNGANRNSNFSLLNSVISAFILVLIFSSSATAKPELLQRQYSSSVYASHSNPDSQSNQQDGSMLRLPGTSLSPCSVECKTSKPRRFCASDGKTYSSKCEIRKVSKCEKKEISVVSKGFCQNSREQSIGRHRASSNCHQELRNIARTYSRSDEVYRPSCHDNGTYRAVQCFHGYCWCVHSDGRHIPRTSKTGGKPNCNTGTVNSQKCTRADRTQFNYKLVKLFGTEFSRLTPAQQEMGAVDGEKPEIIEWKYKELDKNQDGVLNGTEVKTLNRLVRKGVKPKKCAKRFPNYCDVNKDGAISEAEWSDCLDDKKSPDYNRGSVQPTDAFGGNPHSRHTSNPTQSRDSQSAMSFLALLGANNAGLTIDNRRTFDIRPTLSNKRDEMPETQPSSSSDCFEERAQAEENDRNHPTGQIFVPECADGGLFRKEQCHKYTGYCWCVDETTGMPIPGYSTHNDTPDCTDAKPERVMKGCPYPQKKLFLTKILDLLSREMVTFAEKNPSDMSKIPMDPNHSLEERAVRWKFAVLDVNSNKELSRKETKDVKELFVNTASGEPNLRKCARNFLRYCDENNDAKVTTEEWVSCLKLVEAQVDSNREGREGTNPLTRFLKS